LRSHRLVGAAALASLVLLGGLVWVGFGEWALRSRWLEASSPSDLSIQYYKLVQPSDGPPLVWPTEDLQAGITGVARRGEAAIHYPAGLETQARRRARIVGAALERMELESGLSAPIPLDVYLVAIPGRERSIRFDAVLDAEHLAVPVPLPFLSAEQSAEELLADPLLGGWALSVGLHERTQAALVLPRFAPRVAPDLRVDLGPLPGPTLVQRTRWFRDGYSSWFALAALAAMREEAGAGWPAGERAHPMHPSGRPLEALGRVRGTLFDWSQFDDDSQSGDYYAAALGFFLLVEERHGRALLRRVVEAMSALEYVDGPAIEALFAAELGQEPRELARHFELAEPGIAIASRAGGEVSVAGLTAQGAAAAAGVAPGDRILRLGGEPVRDALDYDLALLRHGDRVPLEIVVQRDGARSTLHLGSDADLADADRETVVLLHGLARFWFSMSELEEALLARGYRVVNVDYPSTQYSISALAERLAAEIDDCCAARNAPVHFVTHSLGGILVRGYLARHELEPLGRVVMLSPPNQGSEIVDALGEDVLAFVLGPAGGELGTDPDHSVPRQLPPVDFELGVITGSEVRNPIGAWLIHEDSDGTVSVESARVSGMTDFLVLRESHTTIMQSPEVAEQVLHFLERGRFSRPPE
jgi:hypothetical protein